MLRLSRSAVHFSDPINLTPTGQVYFLAHGGVVQGKGARISKFINSLSP